MEDTTLQIPRKRRKLENSPAKPAQPVLASSIVNHSFKGYDKSNKAIESYGDRKSIGLLKTGWSRKIDENVFKGGIYGVTSVAVEQSEWELELLYGIIIEQLLSSRTTTVYVITIPTSFSALQLFELLCRKIRIKSGNNFVHDGSFMYRKATNATTVQENQSGQETDKSIQAQAKSLMNRVQLMPVFDFKGCLEAVAEVREQTSQHLKEFLGFSTSHIPQRTIQVDDPPEADADSSSMESPSERVIADSQASSPISDLSDKPELSPTNARQSMPAVEPSKPVQRPSTPTPVTRMQDVNQPTLEQEDSSIHPNLLIISNLPQLISPLMRRNHVRGHAHLVTMLRSLRHLSKPPTSRPSSSTSTNPEAIVKTPTPLVSLLFNNTVGRKTPLASTTAQYDLNEYPTGHTTQSRDPAQEQARRRKHRNTEACTVPSVFADNGDVRPALGKTLGYFVDLEVLVTAFPAASLLAGSTAGDGEDGKMEEGLERVLEVLWDKHGMRTGRWGFLGK